MIIVALLIGFVAGSINAIRVCEKRIQMLKNKIMEMKAGEEEWVDFYERSRLFNFPRAKQMDLSVCSFCIKGKWRNL